MGVRTFQAPCSPHSHSIDSVRPATEQPNLTLSITGSMQESMVHCTHRHTISLTVYCTLSHFPCLAISFAPSVFMYVSLSPCLCSLKKGHTHHEHTVFLEVYMHVINQNDHISLAHKALFIARNDDTIDFILPRALCGNVLSVSVSNLCVCVCV